MAKPRKAKNITAVLQNVFRDRHWQKKMSVNRVFLFWNEVVGEEFADLAQPDVIRGGVLWVNVPDSIWMQQLHFLKHDLLEKINAHLAGDSPATGRPSQVHQIEDIRFKIKPVIQEKKKEKPPVVMNVPVDPQREEDFDILIKSIKDSELRDRIRRLWQNLEKRLD